MIRKTLATATIAVAVLTLVTSGCAKKEAPKPAEAPAAAPTPPPPAPLAVASVSLGKAIGADNMVAAPVAAFGVHDTIYASVSTTGVGENATIGAKWVFVKKDGSTIPVNESSQTITTTGPSATEFHITKATPWPKGKYRVEVMLNGATAGSGEFDVQ
jgi:hypothetical protein